MKARASASCGPAAGSGAFFKVSSDGTYSYLLPAALPAGPLRARHPGDRRRGQRHEPRARHIEDRLPCPLGGSRSPRALAAALPLGAAPRGPRGSVPARAAAAPIVQSMVVGAGGADPLERAHGRRARGHAVRVGRRSCAVAAGTPLAVLAALRRGGGPAFALRDYGRCGALPGELGAAVRVLARRRGEPRAERLGVQGGRRRRQHRRGRPERPAGRRPAGCARAQRVLWFWCQASGRRLRAHARSRTRCQRDRPRGRRSR